MKHMLQTKVIVMLDVRNVWVQRFMIVQNVPRIHILTSMECVFVIPDGLVMIVVFMHHTMENVPLPVQTVSENSSSSVTVV